MEEFYMLINHFKLFIFRFFAFSLENIGIFITFFGNK